MKKFESEDIAALMAIAIGGLVVIFNPSKMGDAFETTVWAVILIKLFW